MNKLDTLADVDLPEFKIIVDTREQRPWIFTKDTPTQIATLKTGDCTFDGGQGLFGIERKSRNDIYGCIGQGRQRFNRELIRARTIHAQITPEKLKKKCLDLDLNFEEETRRPPFFAFAVIIDCHESVFIRPDKEGCQLHPNAIKAAIQAWRRDYGINFFFGGTRQNSAKYATMILQHWYNELKFGLWTPITSVTAAGKKAKAGCPF